MSEPMSDILMRVSQETNRLTAQAANQTQELRATKATIAKHQGALELATQLAPEWERLRERDTLAETLTADSRACSSLVNQLALATLGEERCLWFHERYQAHVNSMTPEQQAEPFSTALALQILLEVIALASTTVPSVPAPVENAIPFLEPNPHTPIGSADGPPSDPV